MIDYVTLFADYINGYETPAGSDPAVRYYGLWGIVPGLQISDNGSAPCRRVGLDSRGGSSGRPQWRFKLWQGARFLWESGQGRSSEQHKPPSDRNGERGADQRHYHLPLLGAPGLVPDCTNLNGFHDTDLSSRPYAVMRFESLQKISHEVMEAMTDPYPFGTSAWTTDGTGGLTHHEACDHACESLDPSSPQWGASSGRDITGVNPVILDPSYGGRNNIAADTCAIWEPEQYAPIAITLQPAFSGRSPSSTAPTTGSRSSIGRARPPSPRDHSTAGSQVPGSVRKASHLLLLM